MVCFSLTAIVMGVGGVAGKREAVRKMVVEQQGDAYGKATLLVFYDAQVGKRALLKAFEKMGCEVLYEYRLSCAFAIKVPRGMSIKKASKRLSKVEGVTSVLRDRIVQVH